jgi:signal transduction histidine kinase
VNEHALTLWEVGSVGEMAAGFLKSHSETPLLGEYHQVAIGLAQGKTKFISEEHIRTHKGNWRFFLTQVTVAPGYEKSLSRIYVCFRDITELKKTEEELKVYHEHLEELVSERSRQLQIAMNRIKSLYLNEQTLRKSIQEQMLGRIAFTHALVHELKTPLTPLLACSESLMTSIKMEPERSLIRNVHIGAEKLLKKTDELLDSAKSEVGILYLNRRKISPLKLLLETINYVMPSFKKKNLTLNFYSSKQLPSLKADKERLQQVLFNLLDNAIKYTPSGGQITITVKEQDAQLKIAVADTGIGMDTKQRRAGFEPYKRVSANKDRVGGLGLGLYLSKQIIELHGGNICVSSHKGYGCKFTITLPVSHKG